jgi:hypothetical protein
MKICPICLEEDDDGREYRQETYCRICLQSDVGMLRELHLKKLAEKETRQGVIEMVSSSFGRYRIVRKLNEKVWEIARIEPDGYLIRSSLVDRRELSTGFEFMPENFETLGAAQRVLLAKGGQDPAKNTKPPR